MNDINMDSLTKASIELSEAASNYGALKVIFGVFLVVFLLLVLLFVWQLLATQGKLATIEKASNKSLEYFTELSDRTVGKEEAKMIVCESLDKSEALMKYYILKIRLENHTDDRDFTSGKIISLVNNDLSSRRMFLSRFHCVGHTISFTATEDDNETIAKLMTDWVYKKENEFTVSLMAQAVSLYYNGLRIKAQGKIDDAAEV